MAAAVELGISCEPAKGSVDFEGFSKVLEDVGFAIVEQDIFRPPHEVSLPVARRSLAYYRGAGIA